MKSTHMFAYAILILAAFGQQDMFKQTVAANPPFKLEIGFDLNNPHSELPGGPVVMSSIASSVEIRKTNLTDHTIMKRSQTGGAYGYALEVRDSNGNRVGARHLNKMVYFAGGAGDVIRDTKDMVLQPGESVVDVIPIASAWDIRKPGEYTIQAWAHVSDDPNSEIVKSNVVTITVLPQQKTADPK